MAVSAGFIESITEHVVRLGHSTARVKPQPPLTKVKSKRA